VWDGTKHEIAVRRRDAKQRQGPSSFLGGAM
jgi:hypothetical protein